MSEPPARAKALFRRRMRERLRAIDAAARERWSAAAVERLAALPELAAARNLILFRSLADEVDTAPLLGAALGRGQAVFFPRSAGPSLVFCRVSAGMPWRRGAFGVLEPESEAAISAADVEQGATLAVVPGLAFTERGERLGRGGGHYDRALAAAPLAGRALAVGLAFDLQVVPAVPAEPHDVRVAIVVTERRSIRCRA